MFVSKIYGVRFRNDMMPVSVASVNTKTGIIDINQSVWQKIPPYMRFFVLLHEYCHVEYKLVSELKADEMALKIYKQYGYSEKEAIAALVSLLPFSTYEHFLRISELERISLSDDNKII